MDWIWYQVIAVIALVVSGVTAWDVRKLDIQLHLGNLVPTKKWKKAVSGPKYLPVHKPDRVPGGAGPDDRRFYRDFALVADYLNEIYKEGSWSFENTGRLKMANHGSENGTEREILIRFNQQKTGTIRLSCSHYRREHPRDIRANLILVNGRVFGGREVFQLAQSVGDIVTEEADILQASNINIMRAMIDTMWQVGEEAPGNPELNVTFTGKAEWFLKHWAPKSVPPPQG